jgi:pimeloyl-ACP methyl ester carboxylesterase
MFRYLACCLAICVALSTVRGLHAHDVPALDIAKHTRTIRANDISFPVVDYGKGPVVLMLHGFPDSRHVWRYQIKALGDAGFRVLAPDLRGMGDAPLFQEPEKYGIRLVIQDLLGILDAEGIKKVQLVAHDWGSVVGWRFTAEHPDRIERYVSLSNAAPGSRPTIQSREKFWYMAFFRQVGTAEEQLKADNWQLFREWELAKGRAEIEHDIKLLSRPGALTAALNWYRSPNNANLPPAPPVTVPVLAIWSDGDAYLMEPAIKSSGERVKGPFRYEKIYGASHWMQMDRPDEVNAFLLSFLTK